MTDKLKIITTRDIYTAFVVDSDMVEESLNGKELWVSFEDHQKLEAELKRATMKLSTIDAVAKQLVKMTNIATNLAIQKEEANEILESYSAEIPDKIWIRLRSVLK